MATIQENLDLLRSTKSAIKNAIIEKGVSVSDSDSFASYAEKIGEIEPIYDITLPYVSLFGYPNAEIPSFVVGWDKLTNGYFKCGYSKIETFNNDMPNLTSAEFMFGDANNLTTFNGDLSSLINGSSMFSCFTGGSLFSFSSNLSSLTSALQIFLQQQKLQNITLTGTLNCDSFDLSPCVALTVTSLMNVINALVDLTGQSSKYLILGLTNLNKLSEEQKAIATAKNWVLQ